METGTFDRGGNGERNETPVFGQPTNAKRIRVSAIRMRGEGDGAKVCSWIIFERLDKLPMQSYLANTLKGRTEFFDEGVLDELFKLRGLNITASRKCSPVFVVVDKLTSGLTKSNECSTSIEALLDQLEINAEQRTVVVKSVNGLLHCLRAEGQRLSGEVCRSVHNFNRIQTEIDEINANITRIKRETHEKRSNKEHIESAAASVKELSLLHERRCTALGSWCKEEGEQNRRIITSVQDTLDKHETRKQGRLDAIAQAITSGRVVCERNTSNVDSVEARESVKREASEAVQREKSSLNMLRCQLDSQMFCLEILESRICRLIEESKALQRSLTDETNGISDFRKKIESAEDILSSKRKQVEELLASGECHERDLECSRKSLKCSHGATVAIRDELSRLTVSYEGYLKTFTGLSERRTLLKSGSRQAEYVKGMIASLGLHVGSDINLCDDVELILNKGNDQIRNLIVSREELMRRCDTTKDMEVRIEKESALIEGDIEDAAMMLRTTEMARQGTCRSSAEDLEAARSIIIRDIEKESYEEEALQATLTTTQRKKSEIEAARHFSRTEYAARREEKEVQWKKQMLELDSPNCRIRGQIAEEEMAKCNEAFRKRASTLKNHKFEVVTGHEKDLTSLRTSISEMNERIEHLTRRRAMHTILSPAQDKTLEASRLLTEEQRVPRQIPCGDTASQGSHGLMRGTLPINTRTGRPSPCYEATLMSPHLRALREKLTAGGIVQPKNRLTSVTRYNPLSFEESSQDASRIRPILDKAVNGQLKSTQLIGHDQRSVEIRRPFNQEFDIFAA